MIRMRNNIHTFFKASKLTTQMHAFNKSNHVVRTYQPLIRNNKGLFQAASKNYKYELPKEMGSIIHLTHDQKPNESDKAYNERSYKQFYEYVEQEGGEHFIFLVTSTVFTNPDEEFVNKLREKFRDGVSISTEEIKYIIPGHIAVYTKEGDYISHQRYPKNFPLHSQQHVAQHDVASSVSYKSNQLACTYIVSIKKEIFPDLNLNDAKKIIKDYGVTARGEMNAPDERDNCATAIQKACLKVKIREIMNPLLTMHYILDKVKNKLDLNEVETDSFHKIMLKSGLNRSLLETAKDEYYYKNDTPARLALQGSDESENILPSMRL